MAYSDYFADDGSALAGAYGSDLGSWSTGWDIGTPIATDTGPSASSAGGSWTNALLGFSKVANSGLQAYNSFATADAQQGAIRSADNRANLLALQQLRNPSLFSSQNLTALVPWILGGVAVMLVAVLFLGRRGK
jgi:hypothetical protein